MNTEVLFNMKKVIERTGLTDHTIRVWERRYKAVVPIRSESNRRHFTEDDIAKLQFLKMLTDNGHSIRNIAQFGLAKLSELLVLDEQKNSVISEKPSLQLPIAKMIANCMLQIKNFDPHGLEKSILAFENRMNLDNYLLYVISVLLRKIGEEWKSGNIKISHEHLASAVIRKILAAKLSAINPEKADKSIVFTTPTGQLHEMGVLISAILAASSGIRAIFLGPNLPASEIAFMCNHDTQIVMVVLGIIYPANDPLILNELDQLKISLKGRVKIAVGGSSLFFYEKKLKEISALQLTDFRSCINLYESLN